MKAYVLTTKNSTRLKDGKIENYPSCLPEPEIFYGHTPDEGIKAPDWYKPRVHNKICYEDTTWCCALSKIDVLKHHLSKYPDEDCLILEDDVCFVPKFNELYASFMSQVPDDWKFIYIGGTHFRTPIEVKPNVLRAYGIWGTEFFIVRNSHIQSVIDLLESGPWPCNHASDCVIADTMKDNPTYTPMPFLAGQKSGYSYIREHNRHFNIKIQFGYKDINGKYHTTSDHDFLRYFKDIYNTLNIEVYLYGGIGNCLYILSYGNWLKSLGINVTYKLFRPHNEYTGKLLDSLNVEYTLVDNIAHRSMYLTKEGYLYRAILEGSVTGYPFFKELRSFSGLPDIDTENKIGIHIRRGDFIDTYARSKRNDYKDLCNTVYYTNVRHLCDLLKLPIVIFTDDDSTIPEDIKELFDDAEWCTEDPITSFYKLASCKYKFISNSTFSVWAGYANPDSVVFYPEGLVDRYMLDSWIKLSCDDR